LTARGPLERAEIGEALVRAGVLAEPGGQALYALIRHAGLHGIACYGPPRVGGHSSGPAPSGQARTNGGRETWVAVRDWVGAPLTVPAALSDPDTAVAELARRYLIAHGPASSRDFATWSGLPVSLARKGFRAVPGLAEVRVGDEVLAAVSAPASEAEPIGIRLLGAFDPYLLGYRSRDLMVEAPYRQRVNAGGGMISPVVLADGRIIGTWRPGRRRGVAGVDLFDPDADGNDPDSEAGIAAETVDVVRFTQPGRSRL
jgi:hypothetical protein